MTYELIVKAEAILDMTEAFDWYESKQPSLGTDFLDELEKYFNRITHDPKHYPTHRSQRIAIMHRFPYKIVFEIEGSSIVIYAVYHHKRDPEKLEARE